MSCDPLYTVPIVKITPCGIILPGRSPGNVHSSDSPVPKLGGDEHPIPAFHHPICYLCFPHPVDALSQPSAQSRLTRLPGRANQLPRSPSAGLPFCTSPDTATTAIPQPSCPQPRQTLHHTPSQLLCRFLPALGDSSTQDPSVSSGMDMFALADISRQSTLLTVLIMY